MCRLRFGKMPVLLIPQIVGKMPETVTSTLFALGCKVRANALSMSDATLISIPPFWSPPPLLQE
jgi:hypothetical protein